MDKVLTTAKNFQKISQIFILCLWIMLWAGYNSNFWRVGSAGFPNGMLDLVHGLRAFVPIMAGLFAVIFLYYSNKLHMPRNFFLSPLGLMSAYTFAGLISSVFSDNFYSTLYGDLMFGSVILVLLAALQTDFFKNIAFIINTNWMIAGILAVGFLIFFIVQPGVLKSLSYDSFFCSARPYETLAGVGAEINTFGMVGTRPTGLGRYAGIAAIFSFCGFLFTKNKKQIFLFFLFLFFIFILFLAKGKTEIISFIITMALVVWFHNKFKTYFTVIFGLIILLAFCILFVHIPCNSLTPTGVVHEPVKISVGQNLNNFLLLSGRTSGVWPSAWGLFFKKPLVGYGFQADANFLLNAHNTFLQALIQTGLLGAVPFMLAIVLMLVMMFVVLLKKDIKGEERKLLIFSAAAIAFFGIRSITESAANYSADCLLVAPAIAYMQFLYDNKVRQS